MTGAGDGRHALLVLGFESPDHDVEPWMSLALAHCSDHGGRWERRGGSGSLRLSTPSFRNERADASLSCVSSSEKTSA